jgi:hypothetical protein
VPQKANCRSLGPPTLAGVTSLPRDQPFALERARWGPSVGPRDDIFKLQAAYSIEPAPEAAVYLFYRERQPLDR